MSDKEKLFEISDTENASVKASTNTVSVADSTDIQDMTDSSDKETQNKNTFFNKIKAALPKAFPYYFWLSPILTVIIMNILQSPFINFPISEIGYNFIKFVISALFVLSVQLFATSLFNSRRAGVIISGSLFFVLSFASVVMFGITEEPLLPIDFVMLGQMQRVANFFSIPFSFNIICGTLLFLAHMVSYFVLHKKYATKNQFTLKKYLCMLVVGCAIIYLSVNLICFNYFVKKYVYPAIHCRVSEFESARDYRDNGIILSFFPRISNAFIKVPEGYTKENITTLTEQYKSVSLNSLKSVKNVNVIAIQAESWWDPTKMTNVTFSMDPSKDIRDLYNKGECHFGTFVTPSFGCNTCIPEFEYLTSVSTLLLPTGGYPYTQFVVQDVDSLPSIYKNHGYSTVALHTYDKDYYDRSSGYPLLGFDTYLGDDDLEDPVKKGTYISDVYMAEQIIKQYEQKGNNPMFLYAVSMQNHGNYLEPRYSTYDIQVDTPLLPEDELSGLREGVQGVYDINNAYMHLVNYFKDVDEPVLIVMYGDHLPFLGEGSSTFLNAGYMTEGGLAANPHMYDTPYVVWANYDISSHNFREVVGPQYLSLETLKLSGIEDVPWEFAFADDFYSKYPVYQHTKSYDADGNIIPTDSVDENYVSNYRIVQHHLLFGNDE